jgi:predicted nucleic acid-binding protein
LGTKLVDPKAGHHIYLARIAAVEVASAVARRERGGNLPTATAAAILGQFRQDMIQQYRVLEVTPPLLAAAMLLAESHALRAYDAVQLAVVNELHAQRTANGLAPVVLVSADQELNSAAAAHGLLGDDPNLHP